MATPIEFLTNARDKLRLNQAPQLQQSPLLSSLVYLIVDQAAELKTLREKVAALEEGETTISAPAI